MKKSHWFMKHVFSAKAATAIFVVLTAALMAAPACQAWEVTATNNCYTKITVYVRGHHLFFAQVDCTINKLAPGETRSCTLPGAICPVSIYGEFSETTGSILEVPCFGDVACCWNVKVRINNECKITIE